MLSSAVAYLLWCACFVGLCGLHRFYAGKPLSGLLWLFTLGLLGFGQLLDLILIPGMIASANREYRLGNTNTNTNTNVVHVHVRGGRDYDDDDDDDRPRRRRRR